MGGITDTQNCCVVCDAVESAIKKCDIELDTLRSGDNPLPFKGEIAEDILEQRIEYLEGFRGHLDFLLNHENRMMMQV